MIENEIEIERLLIGKNDKIVMRANETMVKSYEQATGIRFTESEKEQIYSGQIFDYITFEIFCYWMGINHRPREEYQNNLANYNQYLESIFCSQGFVILTRTYTKEPKVKPLVCKDNLPKYGEHLMVAVPSNYLEQLTDYQKDSLRMINKTISNNIDFNIYRYPNDKHEELEYLERININKFYNELDGKTFIERTKKIFRKK